ncbi:MAG: hypothetical protein ACRDOF_04290 [Gaiellaceae bacterium]
MTRLFIAAIALFCLAVPAALAAPPAGQGPTAPNPSQLCAEQLRTMGAANFQSLYAPNGNGKNAKGKCTSRQAQLVVTAADNAAKTCKTERGTTETTITAFQTKYGTNPNKKNAFGKCVSSVANAAVEAQQDATINAARTCKAERALNPAAFKLKYGTNANKANAFGKCVSKLAKEQGSSS